MILKPITPIGIKINWLQSSFASLRHHSISSKVLPGPSRTWFRQNAQVYNNDDGAAPPGPRKKSGKKRSEPNANWLPRRKSKLNIKLFFFPSSSHAIYLFYQYGFCLQFRRPGRAPGRGFPSGNEWWPGVAFLLHHGRTPVQSQAQDTERHSSRWRHLSMPRRL